MNHLVVPDRFTTRSHRLVNLIGYLLIFVVALRRRYDLVGDFDLSVVLFLLGLFTVLYASESQISKRFKSYPRVYFALQMIIVQSLGVFQEYKDTWVLLYVVLSFQVVVRCSRKEAMVWMASFTTSVLVTLIVEFGLISGPGRALAYIVIGFFLVSYDIQYAQHEDALEESQVLLVELQEAHQKLEEYAAQAEKLAAAQERNRIIQELYDSVGQKIFAIQLAAETSQLMLEKDPQRSIAQIEDLQMQTQSVLGQMRQLIGQWRPD
jgi:signal transduction histidine kinase